MPRFAQYLKENESKISQWSQKAIDIMKSLSVDRYIFAIEKNYVHPSREGGSAETEALDEGLHDSPKNSKESPRSRQSHGEEEPGALSSRESSEVFEPGSMREENEGGDIKPFLVSDNIGSYCEELMSLYRQQYSEEIPINNKNKIHQFLDKVLMISAYEVLDSLGRVRKELMDAFSVNDFVEDMTHHPEQHEDNWSQCKPQKNQEESHEIAMYFVELQFVKGYVKYFLSRVLEEEMMQKELHLWRKTDGNTLHEAVLNTYVHAYLANSENIERAIHQLLKIRHILVSPKETESVLADNKLYREGIKPYFYNRLRGLAEELKVAADNLIKDLPRAQNPLKGRDPLMVQVNQLASILGRNHMETNDKMIFHLTRSIETDLGEILPFLDKFRSEFFKGKQYQHINQMLVLLHRMNTITKEIFPPEEGVQAVVEPSRKLRF